MNEQADIQTEDLTRRSFAKSMAAGAIALGAAGALTACGASNTSNSSSSSSDSSSSSSSSESSSAESSTKKLSPTQTFDASTGHNFGVVPEPTTEVGDTLANLKTALTGETGATTKYAAWAEVAEAAGYEQIARLFKATSAAEQIHIDLELAEAQKLDDSVTAPEKPDVPEYETDINLILGAEGEIYEASDMYAQFIKTAIEEGQTSVAEVFTRAKLAEGFHAKWYMDAYTTIDFPDGATYYLCPNCGYIHKGEDIEACPICLAPFSSFTAY